MIRRRRIELVLISLVVALCGLVLRNKYVRHQRTLEAFATSGPLQSELKTRGCEHVALLPMVDFEDLSATPLIGRRADALLAVCDLPSTRVDIDDAWADALPVTRDTDLLVRDSDGSWRYEFHVPLHGRVTPLSMGKNVDVVHRPKSPPWYAIARTLAWRSWQNIAYR